LRGDGRGGFTPLPGQESGLVAWGEQRGLALADFDADGCPDLVLTQNGAATALFRNAAARPGLRVRLAGPPGNPDGVGAVLRLRAGEQRGPACAVLAGAGWGSQDSATRVLTLPGAAVPTALYVRWPGGRETVSALPPEARALVVDTEGRVTVSDVATTSAKRP